MALIVETLIPMNRQAFGTLNVVIAALGLVNGDILSLTTWKGTNTTTSFQGMIGAKFAAEKDIPLVRHMQAWAAIIADNAISDNTALAAADTLAGLRSIFTTNDSSLASGFTGWFGAF